MQMFVCQNGVTLQKQRATINAHIKTHALSRDPTMDARYTGIRQISRYLK